MTVCIFDKVIGIYYLQCHMMQVSVEVHGIDS